jgi:dihydrodipicolinate synthase/N-acetylneuraminate lyase
VHTARTISARSTLAVGNLRSTNLSQRFAGIVAAVVTPCKSAGMVDPEALAHLCRQLVAHGCDGLFIAASTGEAALLDEDDRRSLTVAARNAVCASTAIYTGVSGMGLKQTIRFAKHAAQDGADAAVVMAPFFLRINQQEVAQYLLAIADACPIPVAIYHHPRMTTPIDVETVVRVAKHPNIVAMKETSPNLDRAESLIRATAECEIAVLQGNESLVRQSLALGAHGMVTALAGVVPEWHLKLRDAVKVNDVQVAKVQNDRLVELWKMFQFDEVSRSISAFACAIKLALRRRGWLDQLDGMLSGFTADAAFEKMIDEHLNRVGVPRGDGRAIRLDLPHEIIGDQSAVA